MKNLKKIFSLLLAASMLITTGCDELDEFDKFDTVVEPCEKEIRTNSHSFTAQDFSACSDIGSITLENIVYESEPIVRATDYNIINVDSEISDGNLFIREWTTCFDANLGYDVVTPDDNDVLPPNISSIYDAAYIHISRGEAYQFNGRIDNIVIVLYIDGFECSKDNDSAVELFNMIGARVAN